MKYLIISDLHLTNKFERAKFNFIKKKILSVDKVIICGDFYDGILVSSKKFLNSSWKELFSLLKEKNAVFLPGNHDPSNDPESDLVFCNEIKKQYEFISGGQKFIIQHGHEAQPGLAKLEKIVAFPIKAFFVKVGQNIENFLTKIFKWNTPNLFLYRHLDLKKTKKYKTKNIRKEDYLILGHIHLPYSNDKLKYINSGYIMHGLGSYVVVENGKAQLFKETY